MDVRLPAGGRDGGDFLVADGRREQAAADAVGVERVYGDGGVLAVAGCGCAAGRAGAAGQKADGADACKR